MAFLYKEDLLIINKVERKVTPRSHSLYIWKLSCEMGCIKSSCRYFHSQILMHYTIYVNNNGAKSHGVSSV